MKEIMVVSIFVVLLVTASRDEENGSTRGFKIRSRSKRSADSKYQTIPPTIRPSTGSPTAPRGLKL
ncbi:unnamed protein product [Nezara viridula]|uniref:Neuropeptide n=1 Tax=Nezara viridula TaxID=85310 RepID=A0A9P0HTW7_NEZVI|nr:unnamed protein product [Nezara viridula]